MEVLLSFYSLLSILLGLVWLLLFLRSKEVRQEMLILGVMAMFILPTTTLVLGSAEELKNSLAQLTIFDLSFAFFMAGIAGAIYHNLFGKHYHRLMPKNAVPKKLDAKFYLLQMFLIFTIFVWSVVILSLWLELNTALSILISAVVAAMYMVLHRLDLLRDALWSGLLTMLVAFVSGTLVSIVSGATLWSNLVESSILIGSVPLDLLLWSMSLGLIAGPLYEYTRHLEIN